MKMKYRNWVFTIPQYSIEDEERLNVFMESIIFKEKVNYMVYGREDDRDDGIKVLEGFVSFKYRLPSTVVIGIIGAFCQPARSYEAIDYVKKSGDFVELGNTPSPLPLRRETKVNLEV